MKALVLGGSGLIGNAIARRLAADGARVTVVSRRATRPANLVGLEVAFLSGNVDDRSELDAWVAKHDLVVDAAAPYALNLFHASTAAEREPMGHARSRTDALLTSAMKHGVALAYVGTLSMPSLRAGGGIAGLQSRLIHGLQPYFEIKEMIEREIATASRAGLSSIVVRPSACFGPWDIKPREQCWVPALLRGEMPLTLEQRINVVDTRDVADALVDALRAERYGEAIAVTGHNTSVSDLCRLVCSLGGVTEPKWSVPAAYGVLPALWAELAWAVLGRSSPLPSLVPMLLCEQDWIAPDAAKHGPARPLADTAHDAIAWYRGLGYC